MCHVLIASCAAPTDWLPPGTIVVGNESDTACTGKLSRGTAVIDDTLLVTTSERPQSGAADLCPLWTRFESGPPPLAFSNRLDNHKSGHQGVFEQCL